MTMWQTRRRFLAMTALAGATSLFRGRRIRAAEGLLETTTIRLGKGSCAPPLHILPKSCCVRRVLPMFATRICRGRPLTLGKP